MPYLKALSGVLKTLADRSRSKKLSSSKVFEKRLFEGIFISGRISRISSAYDSFECDEDSTEPEAKSSEASMSGVLLL